MPLDDVVDAFVAEARACERAMIFAAEMGFTRIMLEGDSLFVPRAVNRAAHALVMEGRHHITPCFWVHDLPKSAKMVLAADWKAWV